MYLSRIELKAGAERSAQFWRAFETPYRVHAAVWSLFDDHPDRQRDFLYRLEGSGRRALIFTLSARVPQDRLGLWNVATKPYAPALAVGDTLNFLLRVNPCVKREGRRHDLVMARKKQLQADGRSRGDWPAAAEIAQAEGAHWLREREERLGVKVLEVTVDGYRVEEFWKPKGGRVRFATCDYRGVVKVTEIERFMTALMNGVGPEKGFGCGLLLCKRSGTSPAAADAEP
jgi:CRISPR system Cascade subunit CasE